MSETILRALCRERMNESALEEDSPLHCGLAMSASKIQYLNAVIFECADPECGYHFIQMSVPGTEEQLLHQRLMGSRLPSPRDQLPCMPTSHEIQEMIVASSPNQSGALLEDDRVRTILSDFLFDGKFALTKVIADAISRRVRLWSTGTNAVEWAALLTGPADKTEDFDHDMATMFFELPTYNIDKRNHLAINMADVEKIDRNFPVLSFLHSHPGGDPTPSFQDWGTFLYMDFKILRRPILYVILTPNGEKTMFSFKKCHESNDCALSLLKYLNSEKTQVNPYLAR